MTLIERKQKLLQRLETVFDEHLINEIEQLLDQKEQKKRYLILFFGIKRKDRPCFGTNESRKRSF